MSRPIIGLLLDYETDGSFSKRPHYALRQAYFEAVWGAGGVPVGLGYMADSAQAYLEGVNGLIIPGGFYPFPAAYYDDTENAEDDIHPRHAFELSLVAAALARKTPVLGICAGMQVIAAQAGVQLYKDLKSQVTTETDHLNEQPAEARAHAISVTSGTKLHAILGQDEMQVNTAHNEAPKPPEGPDAVPWPDNLIISATASDGVVEAIERTDHPFCLGVQWHPEFFLSADDPDARLFKALVGAGLGACT